MTPPSLRTDMGYDETRGANVSLSLTMPLSDPLKGVSRECADMAQSDRNLARFQYVIEMWQDGIITRATAEKEAENLGFELTPDTDDSEMFVVQVP